MTDFWVWTFYFIASLGKEGGTFFLFSSVCHILEAALGKCVRD